MNYVGVDVHKSGSTYCVLDEEGRVVTTRTVLGPPPRVIARLAELKEPFEVCFEASTASGYIYDRLSTIATRVVAAHPKKLKGIFASKHKNDRHDARFLAMLLLLGRVPAAHIPRRDIRDWRGLIRTRERLVTRRTAAKNALRALVRGQGIVAPKNLWTKAHRQWLGALDMGSAEVDFQRTLQLDEVEHCEKRVRQVTALLDHRARQHAGVQLLRTIPGVGPRTAEAVVAFVDDPARFHANKAVGNYFGLVPSEDNSGGTVRRGHITREGPALVRRLLNQAAWRALRCSPRVRERFERIERGDRQRKKIALVAIMHYLVRVMHAMLRKNESWRP